MNKFPLKRHRGLADPISNEEMIEDLKRVATINQTDTLTINMYNKGGETTFENLQTLCQRCNLGKGSMTDESG